MTVKVLIDDDGNTKEQPDLEVRITRKALQKDARDQLKQELIQEAIDEEKKRLRKRSRVIVGIAKFFKRGNVKK